MRDVLAASSTSYESRARVGALDVGANVGADVGVRADLLRLLKSDLTLSAAAIAASLGTTSRTIERHLADLKSEGRPASIEVSTPSFVRKARRDPVTPQPPM